ncbi:Drug resistance protein [Cyphellophora attinorum]|uniref:Drug resistance protein n=1 Tax=Cyphellophora attinorum TaxID=1664694 RepID=A0A0N1HCD9_9EURO|nr:Drug resistance protein [Phialophora attinorum]KPI46106.1 Drug resistance protein [Phialophora attinorum]
MAFDPRNPDVARPTLPDLDSQASTSTIEDGTSSLGIKEGQQPSLTSQTKEGDLEIQHTRIPRPQNTLREALFITVICSSQLLTQAGLAQSIVPQHVIASSFDLDKQPSQLSCRHIHPHRWTLGDVFGHKRLFIGGFAWFAVWSAIAGFSVYSSGPILFDICRAMQGIGPAFLLPNAIAMIARTYEPGMRQNLIFCLFGATAPGGFVLGAVFTALLAQKAWWPWAYWIMSMICIACTVLAIVIIPATPPPTLEDLDEAGKEGRSGLWEQIDVLGSLTGLAALVLFNFAWNQGPVAGWKPYTYIILIISVLVFAMFIFVEKRISTHPLIPFGVLEGGSFFTLACISAGWSSFGIFVYYMWNFLEILRHHSILLISAQITPIAISGLCAALTTGFILNTFRPSTVILISMTAFFAGGVVLATMPVGQTYWAQTFIGIIILPWGMDMSFPAATIILSRAMPKRHQGLAASLVNTFVNYSISIGLGVAGTVDSQVNQQGMDILGGYRGALYTGVGLAGMGVVIALMFCLVDRNRAGEEAESPA